jgi:hypothetical protein
MGFLGFPHGLCEVKTVQKYLVNQKLSFPVAPKSETTLSIRETIYVSKETILITALLAVGSTLVNPLGVVTRGVALSPLPAGDGQPSPRFCGHDALDEPVFSFFRRITYGLWGARLK